MADVTVVLETPSFLASLSCEIPRDRSWRVIAWMGGISFSISINIGL